MQLFNFINTVYLPINPYNEQAYDCQIMTMNDILAAVWKHANILNESFSKWCGNKKLKLMQATPKRKLKRNSVENISSLTVRIEK